eukprot:52867_1
MPAAIINDHLYVFGGHAEDAIPFSSIEICPIPPLITMDPSTVPSAFSLHPSVSPSTGNPSVSPSNTPSKYPSKRPSTSPVFNPSVSPLQQPSNQPTSSRTSPPLQPSSRTDIPSLFESTNVTHYVSTYQSSISSTNMNTNATYTRDGTEPTNESESWTWSVIVWMIIAGVILILIATIIYCKRHPNKDNIIPGPGGMEEAETKQDDKVVALTVRPNQLRKSGSSLLVTSEGPCDNLHNRTVIGDIAKDENKSGDNRNNSDNLDDIYIVGDHGEKSISKSDQNKALHEQRTTEGAKDQKESFHGTKGDYYDEYHHQMYKERIKKHSIDRQIMNNQ